MGKLFEQLLGHWLMHFVPASASVGAFIAFGLWCLDYAAIEIRRRKMMAIILILLGLIFILPIQFLPIWTTRDYLWMWAAGIVIYLPVRVWTKRKITGKMQ